MYIYIHINIHIHIHVYIYIHMNVSPLNLTISMLGHRSPLLTQRVSLQPKKNNWLGSRTSLGYRKGGSFAREPNDKKEPKCSHLLSWIIFPSWFPLSSHYIHHYIHLPMCPGGLVDAIWILQSLHRFHARHGGHGSHHSRSGGVPVRAGKVSQKERDYIETQILTKIRLKWW